MRYVNSFLSSECSEDILWAFSNTANPVKEITESMALLKAAKKHVSNLDDCYVIVIGDGKTPRTGLMFSYYTKATVTSVDPKLDMSLWSLHFKLKKPKRTIVYKSLIEDLVLDCHDKDIVVVWPHSHAKMGTERLLHYQQRTDIAMPCCLPIPEEWLMKPHISFKDKNVFSQKNNVYIWVENKLPKF